VSEPLQLSVFQFGLGPVDIVLLWPTNPVASRDAAKRSLALVKVFARTKQTGNSL